MYIYTRLISSSQPPEEKGAVIIPILQQKKLRHREGKDLAQCHTADQSVKLEFPHQGSGSRALALKGTPKEVLPAYSVHVLHVHTRARAHSLPWSRSLGSISVWHSISAL